jgi:2-polyprenyl-3-methyl-5-hydroxy-6-metoxy-1,4-benzoquinol methylase
MFIDKNKDHFKYGINEWTGEPNKPVFYNKEMALKIRELKKPVNGLQMDIVKYPEFLAIRLYENNFSQYDGSIKMQVIEYVEMVKKILETYGVRVELEGKPGGQIK